MPIKIDRSDDKIIASVRLWVESMVVGLNLCPFAKRELQLDKIRFVVSQAKTEEELLVDLFKELNRLHEDLKIETVLLIHPEVLKDFYDYNQFLDLADALLLDQEYDGVFQVASFHPEYQFAGTEPGDARNFTNKAPYPLLHLLREASLDLAIENHSDTSKIPERNARLMSEMGVDKLMRIWKTCLK